MANAYCEYCLRTYPKGFVQPFVTEKGSHMACPNCALELLNDRHGLPKDTPFRGPMARALHESFNNWLAKHEET